MAGRPRPYQMLVALNKKTQVFWLLCPVSDVGGRQEMVQSSGMVALALTITASFLGGGMHIEFLE